MISAVSQIKVLTPIILIKGTLTDFRDAYLVIEKDVICKVPIEEILMILLASYYVFDMKYPQGLTNLYMFLENYFLGFKVPREKTKINNLISELAHI